MSRKLTAIPRNGGNFMARLGKVFDDADLNGGIPFNDPVFRKKDSQENERFIKQLARKVKFFLEHGHVRMDEEEF